MNTLYAGDNDMVNNWSSTIHSCSRLDLHPHPSPMSPSSQISTCRGIATDPASDRKMTNSADYRRGSLGWRIIKGSSSCTVKSYSSNPRAMHAAMLRVQISYPNERSMICYQCKLSAQKILSKNCTKSTIASE